MKGNILNMSDIEEKKVDFSVIIPCANEEKYIINMLEDVCAQSAFNHFSGEIIIADGESSDDTVEKINQVITKQSLSIKVINNPERHVSPGLNKAIKMSKGRFIVRMDVHARYKNDYIDILLQYIMKNPKCGNVGFPVKTLPGDSTPTAEAISAVISHPLGVGNSTFRTGNLLEPISVDTVPFGCFRASLFNEIGYFDLELTRNQDDEFNNRICLAGFDVILLPSSGVEYYGRDTFSKLRSMYYQYGLFKPLVGKKLGRVMTIRQLVPPVLVLAIISSPLLILLSPLFLMLYLAGVGCYCAAGMHIAKQAERSDQNSLLGISKWPYVAFALMLVHISYGFGYLRGALTLLTKRNVSINHLSR
jgi:glycosyltransferase involved in cell wall biosynthesis